MAEDWDLSAIVRSCSSNTSVTNSTTSKSNTNTNNTISDTKSINNDNNNNKNSDTALDSLAALTFGDHEEEEDGLFSFPNPLEPEKNLINNLFHELHDSYKPFSPGATITSTTTATTTTPFYNSFHNFGGFSNTNNQNQQTQLQSPATTMPISSHFMSHNTIADHQLNPTQSLRMQKQQQASAQSHRSGVLPSRPLQSQTPRSRKKKNSQKRTVLRLTAENLADDVWAWRKYGQKPIKGSPYPRNYYRCSSSKGCVARKQVERCNTDPNIFIVSYTGEHTHPRPTHRNSLAGSTRNKFQASQKQENNEETKMENINTTTTTTTTTTVTTCNCSSSPLSTTSTSPTTPLSSTASDQIETENYVQTVKTEAVEDTCQAMESDDDDEEEEDDDDILIPNMALSEDFIKELNELGNNTTSSGSFGLADHSPDFDDNFSNWTVGSTSVPAAGDHSGNGC